jgi:hypothetical protein
MYLAAFVCRNFVKKIQLATMKVLLSFENPSSNPFRKLVLAFNKPPVTLKSCSESRL